MHNEEKLSLAICGTIAAFLGGMFLAWNRADKINEKYDRIRRNAQNDFDQFVRDLGKR